MPFCRVYKRMMGLEPTTFCMAIESWFPRFRAQTGMVEPTECHFRAPTDPRETGPFAGRRLRFRHQCPKGRCGKSALNEIQPEPIGRCKR
jgi:hypothetical protein